MPTSARFAIKQCSRNNQRTVWGFGEAGVNVQRPQSFSPGSGPTLPLCLLSFDTQVYVCRIPRRRGRSVLLHPCHSSSRKDQNTKQYNAYLGQ